MNQCNRVRRANPIVPLQQRRDLKRSQPIDALTARLQADGVRILGAPRRTGGGYYEAVIADPDGNTVEITV